MLMAVERGVRGSQLDVAVVRHTVSVDATLPHHPVALTRPILSHQHPPDTHIRTPRRASSPINPLPASLLAPCVLNTEALA